MASSLRQLRATFSSLPRTTRVLLISLLFFVVLLSLYSKDEQLFEITTGLLSHGDVTTTHYDLNDLPESVLSHTQSTGVYRLPLSGSPPSVNLVIAAMSHEDISWTKDLKIPNLNIIHYVADNMSAPHHPEKNKGHEAGVYLSYFRDFFDREDLADVNVMVHASDKSWHVEQLLDQSIVFSLNHLDLREVQHRQFLNLRVTWGIGCSTNSINTSRVNEESGVIPEQTAMQEAFRANFNIYTIPEILATPCCSQIAVTKEAIRGVKGGKEQFERSIRWLMETGLDDGISGRTWEHMWQYLFLGKAIDCPVEHRAYCRLYHICFGGAEAYDEWIELQQGRTKLEEELARLNKEEDASHKQQEQLEEAQDTQKKALQEALGKAEKDDEKQRIKAEMKRIEEQIEKQKKEEEEKKKDHNNKEKEKAKQKLKEWLEEELVVVKEAIRVRREVAVVRGAIEHNRVVEGENVYGDEVELPVEKVLGLVSTTKSSNLVATSTRLY